MTEQELQEFLEANKADIQAEVRRRMIDKLVSTHQWAISEQVAKTVNEFVAKEIVPEIVTYLAGEKGAILEACKAASIEIGNTLTKTMAEKAAKNIDGYYFRDVIQKLFA